MEKPTYEQMKELKRVIIKSGIKKDIFQRLLNDGLLLDFIERFMERTKSFFRVVTVDYTRTPEEAIKATRRFEFIDEDNSIVKSMPARESGIKKDVKVEFFQTCKQNISNNDLAKEFKKRGLTPDPYAVAAVNEADPDFALEYPNGTHWKDSNGNWCSIAFDCHEDRHDERYVHVHHCDKVGFDRWWYGGVRK